MKKQLIKNWSDWIDFTSGGIFQAPFGGDWKPNLEIPMVSCYGAHYRNTVTDKYIEKLKEFTGFESVALFSTGAEATEAFWRCARVYHGKPGIWGGQVDPDEVGTEKPKPDAMHGMTLGALIMAGKMTYHSLGIWPELGIDRFGQAVEGTSAAIMEPYHAPSAQFYKEDPTMTRWRTLYKEHSKDVAFCFDEIQGGFGRTGKLFGYEWYDDLKPDFVTVGKMMGGGFPLSALLGPKKIMECKTIKEHGHLHSTHSGHPLMCHIGSQVIDKIRKENLIGESIINGSTLWALLADIRVLGNRIHSGKGLLAGIEFKDNKEVQKVVAGCRKKGLLVVDTGHKWIKIGPPLNISVEDLKKGVEILTSVIAENR